MPSDPPQWALDNLAQPLRRGECPTLRLDTAADFGWTDADFRPDAPAPRLIVVGDVHACLGELKTLLAKVGFDPEGRKDRLVSVGDLVAKGPSSRGVVELLRNLNAKGFAWSTRGNHDDVVCRWGGALYASSETSPGDSGAVSTSAAANGTAGSSGGKSTSERRLDELVAGLSVGEGQADGPLHASPGSGQAEHDGPHVNGGKKAKKDKKDKDQKAKKADKADEGPKAAPVGPPRTETFAVLKFNKEHHKLALLPEKAEKGDPEPLGLELLGFLGSLPLAIEIDLPGGSAAGQPALPDGLLLTNNKILIVHAGVVPTVPLQAQDPKDLMYIRSILPRSGPKGQDLGSAEGSEPGAVHWLEFLARSQESGILCPEFLDRTIVFGHDAIRGLQDACPTALGLDTGCVYGNGLTCAVWEWSGGADGARGQWGIRIERVESEKVWSIPKGAD
ncbi:Metallo-dependent phosphatase-like protein [Hyaloraphidium curvatum]|nr:Metallo-dependent phosphatase-like protein [Hyaloraphidium curvatum]